MDFSSDPARYMKITSGDVEVEDDVTVQRDHDLHITCSVFGGILQLKIIFSFINVFICFLL